ncbi:type 4a pilus biogenesis protein PilO [Chitinivorax tropicus]|uniref:type 4a pilus biogenesis protein PilO n=1 Tax=Chitinivorax tropicus TaxID=714531 RepID=UPI00160DA216|nr:type 4a pilus biogenesis protein PilO [Chitinivorax tropicus]
MTLDELRNLDPKDAGNWPLPVQLGSLMLILLIAAGLGYWQVWMPQLEQLDAGRAEEEQLKTTYLDKKGKAVNLDAYKQQLIEIEQSFGAMLKQLPKKSEIDSLLTEVNQVGLGRGLQFLLFKPGAEIKTAEMAELPVEIRVGGSYHDFSAFASDIAQLSRIVTLNDINIKVPEDANEKKNFPLVLSALAKTYRYLDPEEALAVKKAEADKKKSK